MSQGWLLCYAGLWGYKIRAEAVFAFKDGRSDEIREIRKPISVAGVSMEIWALEKGGRQLFLGIRPIFERTRVLDLRVPSCGVSQGKADVLEQRERDLRV